MGKVLIIGDDMAGRSSMLRVFALAAMLGIGGGMVEPLRAVTTTEPEEEPQPDRNEQTMKIIARSRDAQALKRARRQARYDKSEKNKIK